VHYLVISIFYPIKAQLNVWPSSSKHIYNFGPCTYCFLPSLLFYSPPHLSHAYIVLLQVPFKGRSISASNKPRGGGPITVVLPNGKIITAPVVCQSQGHRPCTMILPNGKLIYVDNYSFV